jgi:hypothetical protein
MPPQVARQPVDGEGSEDEDGEEQAGLPGAVVTGGLRKEDQQAQPDEHQRDDAVKAARSEWGQGSIARTISRPRSESVHACFRRQALQICGFAR